MKIAKDTVVTIKYKVSDAQGKLIEASPEPMAYLHGGYQNTLPKIEEALDGKEKGYQTVLNLAPADAFGERDESLVRSIPKTDFPPASGRREVGLVFAFTAPIETPMAGSYKSYI